MNNNSNNNNNDVMKTNYWLLLLKIIIDYQLTNTIIPHNFTGTSSQTDQSTKRR